MHPSHVVRKPSPLATKGIPQGIGQSLTVTRSPSDRPASAKRLDSLRSGTFGSPALSSISTISRQDYINLKTKIFELESQLGIEKDNRSRLNQAYGTKLEEIQMELDEAYEQIYGLQTAADLGKKKFEEELNVLLKELYAEKEKNATLNSVVNNKIENLQSEDLGHANRELEQKLDSLEEDTRQKTAKLEHEKENLKSQIKELQGNNDALVEDQEEMREQQEVLKNTLANEEQKSKAIGYGYKTLLEANDSLEQKLDTLTEQNNIL
jgi:chromosome segregation ATPase